MSSIVNEWSPSTISKKSGGVVSEDGNTITYNDMKKLLGGNVPNYMTSVNGKVYVNLYNIPIRTVEHSYCVIPFDENEE